MAWQVGNWAWSKTHGQACRILEVESLWGTGLVCAYLPGKEATVRLAESALQPLEETDGLSPEYLAFVSAAARIADSLATDQLLAPLEATVIPLPHQIHALSRAISGDRVRYLLADEVGLGKTIEAGLIMRELKLRGLVNRVLVVAPTGLITQWVAEMRTHFNEEFRLVIPGQFTSLRKLNSIDDEENLWHRWEQVVCPMDSVKPIDSRRGWSWQQVERYNRDRFVDLISAGWDLVIIDEAHRLGGSTEQVARYKLGEALSQAAPYLLLLSATPHQGKSDAFRRLLAFLDRDAFVDEESITRDLVAPYVIRTEKRVSIDTDGEPLFKPRFTQLVSVQWQAGGEDQRALYDAVTEYVRTGYNQAMREKNTAVGFLMILMQRLVTSSTSAIRTALERRLEVLKQPNEQLTLFAEDVGEDWAYLDSQEQMDEVLSSRLKALRNERQEVELLLSAARRCEAKSPDAKAQTLLDWMYKLQREENDPDLKFLVFTEFIQTQQMLVEFLTQRGFKVTHLNGSMGLEERMAVQKAFAREAQVLISTDAGGEGLNLQFCHVVFNLDLPWNPMKLEQRIGRVDRIGQDKVVRAFNFALGDTVELRVREVLEEKLQTILEEFGVDKLADVLDSEEGGIPFEETFKTAILSPDDAEKQANALAEEIRKRALEASQGSKILATTTQLDPDAARKIANHQVPFWTERMVLSHLRQHEEEGTYVRPDDVGYRLNWPDGTVMERVVFNWSEAESADTLHLTLDDPKVRALVAKMPHFAPGQPIPAVQLPGISDKVAGVWSLWRISLQSAGERVQRVLPVFVSDDGRSLAPTAKAIWDHLISNDLTITGEQRFCMFGAQAQQAHEACREEAEKRGEELFRELLDQHQDRMNRERKKSDRAFEARKRAIDRIGLETVRNYRMRKLEEERQAWLRRMTEQGTSIPELSAIVLVRIARQGAGS